MTNTFHGLIHFVETGEVDGYRFSLLPCKQEKLEKIGKKKKETFFKPPCIPPQARPPDIPFIYVNMMGIIHPAGSHSPG